MVEVTEVKGRNVPISDNLTEISSGYLFEAEIITSKYVKLFDKWLNPEAQDAEIVKIDLNETRDYLKAILDDENVSADVIFDAYHRLNQGLNHERMQLFVTRNRNIAKIWADIGIDRYSHEPFERFEEPGPGLRDFHGINHDEYEQQLEMEYKELDSFNEADDQLYEPYKEIREKAHQRVCLIVDQSLTTYTQEIDQVFESFNEMLTGIDNRTQQWLKKEIMPLILDSLESEGEFDNDKLVELRKVLEESGELDPDKYLGLLHSVVGKDVYHLISLMHSEEPKKWLDTIKSFYRQQQTKRLAYGDLGYKIDRFLDWQSPHKELYSQQYEHYEPKTIYDSVVDNSDGSIYARTLYWNTLNEVGGLIQISNSEFDIEELDNQIGRDLGWIVLTTNDRNRRTKAIKSLEFYPSAENINLLLVKALNQNHEAFATKSDIEFSRQTLLKLIDRQTWPNLWEQMIETYPEWTEINIEDVVEGRKSPQMIEVLYSILTRLKLDKASSYLIKAVGEALPTENLILWLANQGELTKEEVVFLNQALAIFDTYHEKDNVDGDRRIESGLGVVQFGELVREKAGQIIKGSFIKENDLSPTVALKRLAKVAGKVVDYHGQGNEEYARFYASNHSISLLESSKMTDEQFNHYLSVIEDCPTLVKNKILRAHILSFHSSRYLSDLGRKILKSVYSAYNGNDELVTKIIPLLDRKQLKLSRAKKLAPDLLAMGEPVSVALGYPETILADDVALDQYKGLVNLYRENKDSLEVVYKSIQDKGFSVQQAAEVANNVPSLVNKGWENGLELVVANYNLLNESGLKFVNQLVGIHGKQAIPLIRSYIESAQKNEMNSDDWPDIIELTRQFRVLSPQILRRYKEAKQSASVEVFVSGLKLLSNKITSGKSVSEEERKLPYYFELIQAVFPNNAENYSSYQSISSCEDRSNDLKGYKIRSCYEIDTLRASEVTLKPETTLDENSITLAQKPFHESVAIASELGYDKNKLLGWLEVQVKGLVHKTDENNRSQENLGLEAMLYLLAANYALNDIGDNEVLKQLLMAYHLSTIDDMEIYLEGANERLDLVANRKYALISEINDLYVNRLKDTIRIITEKALNEPIVRQQLEALFDNYISNQAEKFQNTPETKIEDLGLSVSFISKLQRFLKMKTGRNYDSNRVIQLVERYEKVTSGFKAKTSGSNKNLTRGFYGMLRSQREKTLETVQKLSGEEIVPDEFHLEVLDLSAITRTREMVSEGKYDHELFSSYCQKKIMDLFALEQVAIAEELDKFQSVSGSTRTILYGYVTKSKESAYARLTAGVCDSQDNPNKGPQNMWDMPNFFQMILQDPETFRCQGVVTLHVEEENGHKLLCISPNPCSTYLYQSDEKAMWRSLFAQIKLFANDNDFEKILLYSNPNLRTNRSGGEFENAMVADARQIGEVYEINDVRRFSYRPNYTMKKMDVIWKKK